MRNEEQAILPTTIVIFGASGDLTQRKLVPSLFNLYRKHRLPERTQIVGFARKPYEQVDFCAQVGSNVPRFLGPHYDPQVWDAFSKLISYVSGDFKNRADYEELEQTLRKIEDGPANRLYYLAVAPEFFETIIEQLGSLDMAREEEGWRRIVVEKPFGHDLESARILNAAIHNVFHESQVFRIDHYLGKETAQNVLYFRFANTIFEPIWNRNYIDNVQISVLEEVDVEHRAGYYDNAGVLRDMFQNHLLQLLTLVAMEPPSSFKADVIRNEKVEVITAIRPVTAEAVAQHAILGQYESYRESEGVAPGSKAPTYAALRLFIDNWRWQGVPFYLRSGKALAKKASEITIQFRCPPHLMFNMPPGSEITSNVLAICIQPNEGIHLRFQSKVPDKDQEMKSVDLDFHFCETFGDEPLPDAYERLLVDALQGDASLFTRSDEIEMAWHLIDPILAGFRAADAPPPAMYARGSQGPAESDAFIQRDGRVWQQECGV